MLDLDQPIEIEGVSLFGDFEDRRTFHYLPGSPRVLSGPDGQPKMELTRYRGARSGGLLTLEAGAPLEGDLRSRVQTRLEERTGGSVALVPVLFSAGTVRLALLGTTTVGAEQTQRLVVDTVGVGTPNLLGNLGATFAAMLSPEGASLLSSLAAGEVAPVVIAFDLDFEGLQPARGLRMSLDVDAALNELSQHAAAGELLFKADIAAAVERLSKDGHLAIEDVLYRESDPDVLAQRHEEARELMIDWVTRVLARPAPSPSAMTPEQLAASPSVAAAWGARARPREAFVMRELAQSERQRITYDLTETALARRHAAPQAGLVVPTGFHAHDVTIDAGQPLEVRAITAAEADWTAVERVVVDFARGSDTVSIALSADEASGTAQLPGDPDNVAVRVFAQAGPSDLGRPTSTPAACPTAAAVVVDPATAAARRSVRLQLVAAADLTSASGEIRAPDMARAFELTRDRPADDVVVWGQADLAISATVAFADGSTEAIARTIDRDERTVVLTDAGRRRVEVAVALVDPLGRLASVAVELEGPSGTRSSLILTPEQPRATWQVGQFADSGLAYKARWQAVHRDGAVVATDWQSRSTLLLLVGDAMLRAEDISVVVLGGEGVLGSVVRLAAVPDSGLGPCEVVIDGSSGSGLARVAFGANDPRRYRVGADVFRVDTTVTMPDFETTDEVCLLQLPN